MQSLETVTIVALKKKSVVVHFLILANKALQDDSFLVIFSNILEQIF